MHRFSRVCVYSLSFLFSSWCSLPRTPLHADTYPASGKVDSGFNGERGMKEIMIPEHVLTFKQEVRTRFSTLGDNMMKGAEELAEAGMPQASLEIELQRSVKILLEMLEERVANEMGISKEMMDEFPAMYGKNPKYARIVAEVNANIDSLIQRAKKLKYGVCLFSFYSSYEGSRAELQFIDSKIIFGRCHVG